MTKEEKKVAKEEKMEEKKADKEEKQLEKQEKKEVKLQDQNDEEISAAAAATTGTCILLVMSLLSSTLAYNPEGAAVGSAVAAENPKSAVEEPKPAPETTIHTAAEQTPTKSKRGSIFGGLGGFSVFNKKDKEAVPAKRDEVAPATPAKDPEPVAESAPQLAPVDTTTSTEAKAPAATEADVAPASSSATASPKAEKSESKAGLFGFLKQKEAQFEVSQSLFLPIAANPW